MTSRFPNLNIDRHLSHLGLSQSYLRQVADSAQTAYVSRLTRSSSILFSALFSSPRAIAFVSCSVACDAHFKSLFTSCAEDAVQLGWLHTLASAQNSLSLRFLLGSSSLRAQARVPVMRARTANLIPLHAFAEFFAPPAQNLNFKILIHALIKFIQGSYSTQTPVATVHLYIVTYELRTSSGTLNRI